MYETAGGQVIKDTTYEYRPVFHRQRDHAETIVNTEPESMVVRIRFGRGAVVSRRTGKNSRIARLAASLLTLVSISCASFGMWRVGTDLGWTGDFVYADGLLSHWQIWIGAAIAVQYLAWQLTRYARKTVPANPAMEPAGSGIEPAEDSPETVGATSNV